MVLELFKGGHDEGLNATSARIAEMLVDCKHTFDLAFGALLDGVEPASVGKEVRETDVGVNKAERAVRRELLVHVSVRGTTANIPMVLASMSVVKDAERIGDYAKNIWDLAAEGVDVSDAPDREVLSGWREHVSDAIGEVSRTFEERDTESAHRLLKEFDVLLDECDHIITAQINSPGSPREAVPRALLFRYIKRIVAHLMNVLTSLVMPLDRLDYYDEKKADRD